MADEGQVLEGSVLWSVLVSGLECDMAARAVKVGSELVAMDLGEEMALSVITNELLTVTEVGFRDCVYPGVGSVAMSAALGG